MAHPAKESFHDFSQFDSSYAGYYTDIVKTDRVNLEELGMIKERVITVLKAKGVRLPQLEELTGISRYTWSNLKNTAKSREIKSEEIEAVVSLYPEYALWIVSGKIAPESGQTSPEYDEAHSNLSNQSAG